MPLISKVERSVSHSREFGKFLVVYNNNIKQFIGLIEAFKFYYQIEEEACLWDITEGEELLEKKYLFRS